MSTVGLTARWIAAARANESERPDRLFADPLAASLTRAEGVTPAGEDSPQPVWASLVDSWILGGIRAFGSPLLSIRTRFFDDLLLGAVTEDGIGQVVILAAGMDARAFRLPWPAGVRLYELDLPEVLAAKEEVVRAAGAQPACNRVALSVDLTDPTWVDALCAAGFDPETASAWLVEGLLMYLDEGQAGTLLRTVAGLAAPGSRLGADLISAGVLGNPVMAPFLGTMAAQGHPFRFGTDAPEALFDAAGWRATVRQPGEPGANYGRWPLPVAPRVLPNVPREFLVEAQRLPAGTPRRSHPQRRTPRQAHNGRARTRVPEALSGASTGY